MKKLILIVSSALVTAGVVTAIGVLADGNPATDAVPRRIPYKGTLEKDGAAYTGTMTMKFSLYDGTSATASWTETQTATVYGGKFQVLLGAASATSATALDTLVKNGDDLYLSITLATGTGDVVLSNKQRFYPVPYSTWAASAADFSVAGALTVSGATTLKGAATIDGAVTAKAKATIYGAESDGSTASLAVGNAGTTTKLLMDDDEIDSIGNTLKINNNSKLDVGIGDDLTVGATLTTTGNATIKGGTLSLNHGTANVLSFGSVGVAAPGSDSAGLKIKTYGSIYGIGIASYTQWYSTNKYHEWYSSSDGTTFTKRLTLDDSGKLTMTGALQPAAGNGTAYGFQWAQNPGGGSGDSAYIRYYVTSGEATKLVIANENDDDDKLVLRQKSSDLITLSDGKLFVGGTMEYNACPSNYTLTNYMCVRRYSSGKTYMAAQSACYDDGGHVCMMWEAYRIWGSDGNADYHDDGDWLGDVISDDYVLTVNNDDDKSNFESDDKKKTDSRPYTCCINIR